MFVLSLFRFKSIVISITIITLFHRSLRKIVVGIRSTLVEQTTPVGLNFVDKESPVLRLGQDMRMKTPVNLRVFFSKQF